MFYMDGLNTLFAFGGIYAAAEFGLTPQEIIQFGILMNVGAGLGAIGFGWLDDYLGSKNTILISLFLLIIFFIGILLIKTKFWFWVLGLALSFFVGPIQAASRSLMAYLAPEQKRNELFGLFALSGKMTAFMGPWLVGTITLLFSSQRMGMATIVLFLIIGFILLIRLKMPHFSKEY